MIIVTETFQTADGPLQLASRFGSALAPAGDPVNAIMSQRHETLQTLFVPTVVSHDVFGR
jgi:hypothetical protein